MYIILYICNYTHTHIHILFKIAIFYLNLSEKFVHDTHNMSEIDKSYSSRLSITVLYKGTNECILEHSFIHLQTFMESLIYSRQRWIRFVFQFASFSVCEIIHSLCTVKDEKFVL